LIAALTTALVEGVIVDNPGAGEDRWGTDDPETLGRAIARSRAMRLELGSMPLTGSGFTGGESMTVYSDSTTIDEPSRVAYRRLTSIIEKLAAGVIPAQRKKSSPSDIPQRVMALADELRRSVEQEKKAPRADTPVSGAGQKRKPK
jgi:hypothetical protein